MKENELLAKAFKDALENGTLEAWLRKEGYTMSMEEAILFAKLICSVADILCPIIKNM